VELAPTSSAPPALAGNDWPAWTAPVALVAAFVLSAVGAAAVDIPAAILGANITTSKLPPGLVLADTVVQDLAFVAAAVLCARFGARAVHAWQFGLRPTRLSWRRAALAVPGVYVAFLLFALVWSAAVGSSTEQNLLEDLGTNETTLLLIMSALLTTVIAPICEELLFRGYIFAALSKWKGWLVGAVLTGVLFGAVHATSSPAVDLVPLAVLGFLLCVLYRQTGSLYPCIAAHALNNSIAFGVMEHWDWQLAVLILAALSTIASLAVLLARVGVISVVSTEEIIPSGS
jgi:membrane protease YdiL (CAAX protease family)